jgi:predicted nucleotidyltransferase
VHLIIPAGYGGLSFKPEQFLNSAVTSCIILVAGLLKPVQTIDQRRIMATSLSTKVQSDDLKTTRRIVLDGLKGYRVKVYLFGSQATGKFRPTSDIDVAILPFEPLSQLVLANIREALEESNIVRTVDLVDLSEVDDAFKDRVLQEGIAWTE